MRFIVILVAVLAVLYGGYWFVGRAAVERGALRAIAAAEAEGWQVAYADLSTRGFPSRFDTTVTELRVTSPDGALTVEAPFAQMLALSYRPNRVILIAPPSMTVTAAGQSVEVVSEGLRASAAVGLTPDLPLREAIVEAQSLAAAGTALGPLLAAVRAEAAEGVYDIYLSTGGVAVEGQGRVLDSLVLDGVATLDRPLDRTLREPPQVEALALTEARAVRGASSVTATADLAPDAECRLAGQAQLTAQGWQGLLDLGEEAGLLDAGRRVLVERALGALAGEGDRLEVPVTLEGGRVRMLGLPVAEAPTLC